MSTLFEDSPFRPLERLGVGASGAVYRVEDAQGRIVALKVLHVDAPTERLVYV